MPLKNSIYYFTLSNEVGRHDMAKEERLYSDTLGLWALGSSFFLLSVENKKARLQVSVAQRSNDRMVGPCIISVFLLLNLLLFSQTLEASHCSIKGNLFCYLGTL